MLVEGMTEGERERERERERAYLIPLPLLAGLLLLHHDDLQSMPNCVVLWVKRGGLNAVEISRRGSVI